MIPAAIVPVEMGTSVVDLLHDVQLHGDHTGRRLEHPVWDLPNSHLQPIQIARNIVLRRHTTIYISCRGHSPGRTCAICCTAEAVRQYATTWCRRCHTGIHQLCQPCVASTMYCPPCAAFFSIRMTRLRRSNRMQHQGRDVADMLREDILYVCPPQWPVCSLGSTRFSKQPASSTAIPIGKFALCLAGFSPPRNSVTSH